MTHNQIAFWQTQLDYAKNVETARHNKRSEDLSQKQIDVTREYNYLQATNQARSIAEAERHNRAAEALQSYSIGVQREYNLAQQRIASSQLLLSGRQQSTRESAQEETVRHNLAQEAETQRHNTTQETETHRQNTWSNLLGVGKFVNDLGGNIVDLLKMASGKKRLTTH